MKRFAHNSINRLPRRGVTLVEMLVVITILLILFAVAIPRLRPSLERTKLREGTRLAKAAFARARYRSIETGNPVGLVIEPAVAGGGACFSLSFAQIPSVFTGTLSTSTVTVESDDDTTFSAADDLDVIEEGDMIKFNYQGKKYRVRTKGSNGGAWKFSDETGDVTLSLTDARFEVFKPPRRSKQTMPAQLPENVCIDIAASGMGDSQFVAGQTIIVLFNTAGLVEQIYQEGTAFTPTSPVYFLLGDTKTVGTADVGEYWIACGHQTGSIITADVADLDPVSTDENIVQQRRYAREMKIKGGR